MSQGPKWWRLAPLLPALAACNGDAAPQPEESADHARPAAVAQRRGGPPAPEELRARLVARSVRPVDADRLIAALARVGEARAALRRGEIAREAMQTEHDALERLCPEISGLSCDALLFQPRRSP